ncbi:hypothetical protein [Bacteriovorax sp. Seq25_V]|uniref:hypothetical protein n=1 Tax=Bacteriovorax sp. Seq25_V TaxID=1201288 RepID=UPI00038A4DB1|nr:hypothetical protein [Bacteriovorax sp. Seq25_V]EQC44350.1 hypothetical protein M900_A0414 [Bacteriovorax sp. Seq25_V]
MLYCWSSFSFSAVFHTKEDQSSLPDLGVQSCALYERANARNQNRFKLCTAQVVSQTQIIANSECISKLKNSRIPGSHSLHCGGGVITTPVKIVGSKISGNNIITLDKRLPIVPIRANREFKLEETDYKKCFVKSSTKYLNILPKDQNIRIEGNRVLSKLLTKSDMGAGVYCIDENDKDVLVGVLDVHFNIQNLAQIESTNKQSITENDLKFALIDKESINQVCTEGVNCIETITKEASSLTSDMLKILHELQGQLEGVKSVSEIDQLEREYLEIRLRCNQLNIQLGQLNTDFVDTGILSATMGTIESAAISSIESFSSVFGIGDDFLFNQFQNVPIISENLSSEELKKIMNSIEKNNPDLSPLDKIKNVTRDVTEKIIIKIASDMGILRHNEINYRDYVNNLLKDFDKCLEIANSKGKVLECADKISTKAAIKISDIELDNQIIDNFENYFKDDTQEYEKLKLASKDTYYRCISNNMFKEKIESSEVAKGCVFEAILTAYNLTKDRIITDYLVDTNTNKIEIPDLLKSIKANSTQCTLGNIINNEGKISRAEFNGIKKLTTEKFKENLDGCINRLTLTAGRVVTSQTVLNHPQIRSSISNSQELQKVIDTIVIKDYDECIDAQSKFTKQDPNNCRDIITAMTSLHVAKNVMAKTIEEMAEGRYELQNKLTNDVNAIIGSCSAELRKKHLISIEKGGTHPSERETVNCLNLAVGEIANQITHETLTKEFDSNPLLSDYKEQIIKEQKIIALPAKVQECFQTELAKTESIDEFTNAVDSTKEKCQLTAEKEATATIAPMIILSKLTDALENGKRAQEIADTYINGRTGLTARINKTKTKAELTKITDDITKDLTIEGAKYLIPKLVDEMLTDREQNLKEETTRLLLSELKSCVLRNSNTEQCVNESTALGYEKIGGIIIAQNITNVLAPDKVINDKLISQSADRLQLCISKIDTNVASDKYKETINLCMIDEIASLSIELPREAIVLYAPAAGLDKPKNELREKLLSYENFYLLKTRSLPERTDDFIIDSHISHMSCIASVRYELKKRNETDMNKVQKEYSRCTDNVERNIKNGIVQIFVQKHLSDSSLRPELHNVASTLIQLTSNEKKADDKVAPLSETFDQMHLVGDKFEAACKYDKDACKEASKNTLLEISSYKANNPDATSDEILDKFYETELMSLIIKSEIGTSLSKELTTAMDSYMDREGILKGALANITSHDSISKLLSSSQGKKVKNEIIAAIKNGNIDKIMENTSFRKEFAKALIDNHSNDSFIDKLMYGIVQPVVKKEKSTSNGALGIFRNPKVTLGRLFGIVEGKDFDWNKIRNTKEGRKAREIFANDIFAPLVAGESLGTMKAKNSKKYKSRLEELSDQVQENIVEGIKSL